MADPWPASRAHYRADKIAAEAGTAQFRPGSQPVSYTHLQAQLIRDFQPDMIMVTPSYCLNLNEELERQMGGDARGCSLRVGVFGAEPWTLDRKSTRLNSSHITRSRMPSSA